MARKRANGEGTIRKRADGSWEARYCADGKRHSVYGRTQAEVRKKLTEVSVTIDHGDFREDSGLTLGQWLTMWHRDYLGNVKLGTADTYEMQIRVHIIPALGDVKLSALRTPMIQRLYNKKREEGLSPKSIKNIHGCLHKALDVAVRIGYLSKNPSGNCILPRIEQAEIHPLDTPELSKLLAFLKGHEHEALIVTAIFTGLRSGELLGLTWDSVDFENGLIRVTKQLAQPRKKGEVFRFATPKNSKPRTIAPAPTVFQVLKKHKEEQEAQRKALGPAWNDGGFPNLVFTHPDGSHLSQPTAWKILHKILVAAGIDAHRFHDLRHPYVKHTTKIFSLRLMDFQAKAYNSFERLPPPMPISISSIVCSGSFLFLEKSFPGTFTHASKFAAVFFIAWNNANRTRSGYDFLFTWKASLKNVIIFKAKPSIFIDLSSVFLRNIAFICPPVLK